LPLRKSKVAVTVTPAPAAVTWVTFSLPLLASHQLNGSWVVIAAAREFSPDQGTENRTLPWVTNRSVSGSVSVKPST
jgi:hypothetical protein